MKPKFTSRSIFILTTLIAVGLALWLQASQWQRYRQLTQQKYRRGVIIQRLEFDLKMQRIDSLLKVPTETLYQDRLPMREIDRLRWEALEACELDEFTPYFAFSGHRHEVPTPYRFTHKLSYYKGRNIFYEGRADLGATLLNSLIKESDDFRKRVTEDPDIRDDYLKPLLMLLVKSPDQEARLAALESMLLLGDRRPELLDIIQSDLERLSQSLAAEYADELLQRYHRLIEEHGLHDDLASLEER